MVRTTLGYAAIILALTLSLPSMAPAQPAGSGSSRADSGSSQPATPRRPARSRQPAGSGSNRSAASWTVAPSARSMGLLQEATRQVSRHQELAGGYFFLRDAKERQVLALRHDKAHQHVSRIEASKARALLARVPGGNPALLPTDAREVVFACHDFRDVRSKKTVDVDIWMVERPGGQAVPVQYLVHGVNGVKRFAYTPGEALPFE